MLLPGEWPRINPNGMAARQSTHRMVMIALRRQSVILFRDPQVFE
jgi:hypothetical protein